MSASDSSSRLSPVSVADVVNWHDTFRLRPGSGLLLRIACAFLAGLGEIFSPFRLEYIGVGVGDDGDFEGDGVGKLIAENGIKCHADYQDAVYQCCQEQHRGKSVRDRQGFENHIVDRALID